MEAARLTNTGEIMRRGIAALGVLAAAYRPGRLQ